MNRSTIWGALALTLLTRVASAEEAEAQGSLQLGVAVADTAAGGPTSEPATDSEGSQSGSSTPEADPSGAPRQVIVEPTLPQYANEPPPPPFPNHVAPKHSLLVGVRLGWLLPEGDLWANGLPYNDSNGNKYCCRYFGQSWSSVANSGPKLELNVGARLSRYYNVFGIWEHAFLSQGDDKSNFPKQDGGSSNFYGFGFRFSTAPDHTGLLVELALGYRKFSADLGNGLRLETDAAFNARLGIGADIRFNELFSLSPIITLGSGSFSDVAIRDAQGNEVDQISGLNDRAQFVPITFEVGGVFDLFGTQR